MAIRKHLSALVICFLTVFALGGLLPATALAAAPNGQVIYVGNVDVTSGGYWTTDDNGHVTAYSGDGTPTDNYIHYDTANNTLTLHNATIKESVPSDTSTYVMGAAIGVFNQNGAAELTIQLEGTNTIAEVRAGIYVLASSVSDSNASLTIMGSGSLDTSGSQSGIQVHSNSSNATLTIQNADVTANGGIYGYGVNVISHSSSTASLTVEGSSLIASGSSGILYESSGNASVPNTVNLTISNSALVDARDGGIGASITNLSEVSPTDSSVGIVFDGDEGTVYGDVTLQEDLTISEGESLKLDSGASLNAGGHNVIVDGGTLDEGIKNNLGDSVKYTPTITTTSLPNGTAEAAYSTTLLADGTAPITWSVTSGSLTEGLSLDESTGEIIGTPTAEGSSTFTVKAENSYGSDSKELNITINEPASVSVIGVSLDQNTLTLTEDDTTQLTATVEPTNATNKDVTWSSDNEAVAMVDANGNVAAVSAGAATITVTTEDGSFTDTCKVSVKHGNMILTPQKDATCTAQGKLAYYTCETCGKIFSDAEGKTEISSADTVIPTTSHNYKDGKCTVCGDTDPNYQEPTSPAKDEPAAEDSTKNTKDKSATKSSTPQTSDALFGYIVFFAALIVLASIVSVVAYRKLHTVQAKHSSSNKH